MNHEYVYEYQLEDEVKDFPPQLGKRPPGLEDTEEIRRRIISTYPVTNVVSQQFDYTNLKDAAKAFRQGRVYTSYGSYMTWGIRHWQDFNNYELAPEDKANALEVWHTLQIAIAMGSGIEYLFWSAKEFGGQTKAGWWAITIDGLAVDQEQELYFDESKRLIWIYANGKNHVHRTRRYSQTNTVKFKETP